MLVLVDIERTRPGRYVVSLDRNGEILQFEFGLPDPEPGNIEPLPEHREMEPHLLAQLYSIPVMTGISEAMEALVEYQTGPDEPGAFHVPAVWKASKLVRKFARGEKVELPVVLDER